MSATYPDKIVTIDKIMIIYNKLPFLAYTNILIISL